MNRSPHLASAPGLSRRTLLGWSAVCAAQQCLNTAQAGMSASQEPRGYYVLENTDSLQPIESTTLNNPNIGGIVLRRHWTDVNPSPGSFNWSYFDSQISRARSFGQSVQLTVFSGTSAPNWLYNLGSLPWHFSDSRTSQQTYTMPIPWDPIMLARWSLLVNALGARYDSDPTVSLIYAAGPCRFSCEMFMPNNINQAKGWSIPALLAAWDQCIAYYSTAFRNTAVSFNLSHAVSNGDGVPQHVAARATAVLGNMATLQQNSLSGTTSNSYDVQQLLIDYARKGTRTGFEMLCESSQRRFGGSFGGAVSIARQAGGNFVNIYQPDLSNVHAPY